MVVLTIPNDISSATAYLNRALLNEKIMFWIEMRDHNNDYINIDGNNIDYINFDVLDYIRVLFL